MAAPDDRLPISVLLLVRDETRDVEELLPTLAFAREVVVVWDPRGERSARDAAERLGAHVHDRPFDGFGPQRAFALSRCTQDWVLWIDADERLDPASIPTLQRVTAMGALHSTVVMALRTTTFLGRRIQFCGWGGDWLPRLFTRRTASFDDAAVHERLQLDRSTLLAGMGPFGLEHLSYRTWDDCVSKMVRYAHANAEKSWRAGRRAGPLDVLWRPPLRFIRMYLLQQGFREGAHGVVLCAFAAAQVFLKYAELWQRSRSGTRA